MGIDGSCTNKENVALDSVSCRQPESICTNSCLTKILKLYRNIGFLICIKLIDVQITVSGLL